MMRTHGAARGFTLIETAVVLIVLGVIAAFSLPAFLRLNRSLALKGTVQDLAGQIQLARQKAIASATQQILHFQVAFGYDFHYHNSVPSNFWKFPKGVTYLWSTGTLPGAAVTMKADGRASQSGMIILQNPDGLRDTINVQLSGLVLVQ
ncbi:MAG TPA: prepilin-type N-terminal cleavage/methylation domain-containing protein [Candidatus Eisenbacteria bacterium]|jgi:prepilin-type N-terminal cleavage/methylation domain-containing protein